MIHIPCEIFYGEKYTAKLNHHPYHGNVEISHFHIHRCGTLQYFKQRTAQCNVIAFLNGASDMR